MRVLMYSPDSIGLGHMRRNSSIAAEIVRQAPDASVALLIGSGAGAFFSVPKGIDTIKLPSVQKVAAETWKARSLNLSVRETSEVRAGIVCNVIRTLKPDVLLIDHLPMGVCGDLIPALTMIRRERMHTRVVLGIRDILDDPEIIRDRWASNGHYQAIVDHYDQILIYGDGSVYPSGNLYGLDEHFSDGITYTGYVCTSASRPVRGLSGDQAITALEGLSAWRSHEKIIVAAGGGGHDAYPMLSVTLAALVKLDREAGFRAVVIAGPLMPEKERDALVTRAYGLERIRVVPWTADCMDYLEVASVSIVMAGYNSSLEALSTPARVIMMPRPGPSAEQSIRARLLSQQGLVQSLDYRSTTPEAIAAAIRAALDAPPRKPSAALLSGAARAAQVLIGISRRAAPVQAASGARKERNPYVVF